MSIETAPHIYSVEDFSETFFEKTELYFKIKERISKSYPSIFLINKIEDGIKAITLPKKGFKINFFEVFLLTNGSCNIEYNLQDIHHKKGQIRFSSPGSLSLVKEVSADIQGYYVLFNEDFIRLASSTDFISDLPFFFLSSYPLIELKSKEIQHFSNMLDHLITLDENNQHDKLKSTYLTALLLECKTLFKEELYLKNQSSAQQITKGFLNLILSNSNHGKPLKEYAKKLNVSAKHLTKSVKLTLGFPPSHFIKKALILESKIMLKETDYTVGEIAYQLGFNDPSYFVRFFKKHTSETPNSYRDSFGK